MSWFDGEGKDSGGETAPALADNLCVETDNFSVADVSNVGEDILRGGIGFWLWIGQFSDHRE